VVGLPYLPVLMSLGEIPEELLPLVGVQPTLQGKLQKGVTLGDPFEYKTYLSRATAFSARYSLNAPKTADLLFWIAPL